MIYRYNQQTISLAQASLFVAVSFLAIAAILFQLGQASFRLGQSTRKLVDSLDGTGGPTSWLRFTYNRLRPEAFPVEADLLTTTSAPTYEQIDVGVGVVSFGSPSMGELVPVPVEDRLKEQHQLSVPLTCSIAVRQAPLSSNCCLLKSKSGRPLKGNALPAKIAKLQRLGVLVN